MNEILCVNRSKAKGDYLSVYSLFNSEGAA